MWEHVVEEIQHVLWSVAASSVQNTPQWFLFWRWRLLLTLPSYTYWSILVAFLLLVFCVHLLLEKPKLKIHLNVQLDWDFFAAFDCLEEMNFAKKKRATPCSITPSLELCRTDVHHFRSVIESLNRFLKVVLYIVVLDFNIFSGFLQSRV